MLSLWIGRANSGKSKQVLQELRAGGDTQQILLVPEHASHQAEVDVARICGPTASRHVEVLSFQRLASRVLSLTGGLSDPVLDAGGKLLTMQIAWQDVAGRLTVYRHPSQRVSFLSDLVVLADEFHAYGITPESLWEKAEKLPSGVRQKIEDVACLYTAYEAHLRHEAGDLRDRMSKLLDRIGASDYFRDKEIYIDGFSLFNAQEREILRHMLQQARRVVVVLMGEKSARSEIFAESRETEALLLRLAQQEGVPADIRYFDPEGDETELSFLEGHFFFGDALWDKKCEAITLYEADNAYTEVEWVAAQILRLVRQEGYRFREITVAARHIDSYETEIETVFRRYEIPVFLSRSNEISEKPPVVLVTAALEAVVGDYEYEAMFRYLKTGLAGLTGEECDLLENYVICWDIRGSRWLRTWTLCPEGYREPRDEEEQLCWQQRLDTVNALRDRVTQPLQHLEQGLRQHASAAGKTAVLYDFLEELRLPEVLQERTEQLQQEDAQQAEEYRQLWQILCNIMDQMVSILGERELATEEFVHLFTLLLSQYTVGSIPATLDQVQVSEITRNDRHSSRCLFLLGANDHVLPDVSRVGGILTQEEREQLRELSLELAPTGEHQVYREMENLYAALARPRERLVITYPAGDFTGAQLHPSFVVRRIQELFPRLSLQREGADKAYRLSARRPALEELGRRDISELSAYFARQPELVPVLSRLQQADKNTRSVLSPEQVQALYGKDISMSASRMNQLASCHFSYFMQYGLRAKEREKAEFEAPEIGTFLHHLLENVVRDAVEAGDLARLGDERLPESIRRYAQEYAHRTFPDYNERGARFRYLFERLQQDAQRILREVGEELQCSDFVPRYYELEFGKNGTLSAVSVEEDHRTLMLRGKVDRVDVWQTEDTLYLRIVDYKTGKKAFSLAEIADGRDLQMLLYLFALKQQGEKLSSKRVSPAGVLYLSTPEDIRSVAGKSEVQKALQNMVYARSGLVLSDPAVLGAMEHGAPENTRFLPVKRNRSGEIQEGMVSARRMDQLERYVDRALHRILREMESGDVSADPLAENRENTACTYCPYQGACHFEEGRCGDHLRWRSKVTEKEFWEALEKEEKSGG